MENVLKRPMCHNFTLNSMLQYVIVYCKNSSSRLEKWHDKIGLALCYASIEHNVISRDLPYFHAFNEISGVFLSSEGRHDCCWYQPLLSKKNIIPMSSPGDVMIPNLIGNVFSLGFTDVLAGTGKIFVLFPLPLILNCNYTVLTYK